MRVGVNELGRQLGVSGAAINKATKQGRITRGEDGLYDVEECRAKFKSSHPTQQANARKQQTTERAAAGKASAAMPAASDVPIGSGASDLSGVAPTLAEAVLQEKRLKNAALFAKVQEQIGSVAPVAEFDEFASQMILAAKDVLLRIPVEMKTKLAHISDESRIEALLHAEIYRALGELSTFRPSIASVAA